MFALNEAPNKILNALDVHQNQRNCGTFWSIFCCPITLGATIGCCDDGNNNNWRSCCYPKNVSLESDVTLNVLQEKLIQLKISKKKISQDSNFDERKLIEWQVKQTLAILNKSIKDNIIQGSYKDIIIQVRNKILTQAKQEEEFGRTIDLEISPLINTQPYTPNYGLSPKINVSK